MKFSNIGYLLKEGFKGIFLHGFMSFAAVCVTVACLIIVGSFSILAYNLDVMVQDLNQTSEILVYVDSDLSDAEAITFTYLGRFTVRLPWDSDLDYIFRSVQDLVNGLESNETGEINYMLLKSKGEMHFIPSAPGA